jgi:hypothetical protein
MAIESLNHKDVLDVGICKIGYKTYIEFVKILIFYAIQSVTVQYIVKINNYI